MTNPVVNESVSSSAGVAPLVLTTLASASAITPSKTPVVAAKDPYPQIVILADPIAKRMAEKIYQSFISSEDFSRFPAFIFELESLLKNFGGQPLPTEDEEQQQQTSTEGEPQGDNHSQVESAAAIRNRKASRLAAAEFLRIKNSRSSI